MKRDEGYIKFNVKWEKGPAFSMNVLHDLNHWRAEMYRLGLIGAYPDGIGFGNISQRANADGQFYITGSATGLQQMLTPNDYTLVSEVHIPSNTVWCRGPIVASSESMSHAVIYQTCDWVNGVIHVHHLKLWERLLGKIPTTDASATYGTPEMADSIVGLLQTTNLADVGIFVMEGHAEGVFSFGKDLQMAAGVIGKWMRIEGL